MNKRLKIIVACNDAAGIRLIKSILSSGHIIAGVLASHKANLISSPHLYAIDNGIKTWHAAIAKNDFFADVVVAEQADMIISLRFPFVFSKKVIEAPGFGAFNLHTGLLPQYAGANVSSWAIFNGEPKHGVTLHEMEAAIDTGPIVDQICFDIGDNDTGLTLTKKSITFGISLIIQFLDKVSKGEKITSVRQNMLLRKYYPNTIPQQGCINWTYKAQMLFNFIRACDFYPLPSPLGIPQAALEGEKIFICKGTMTESSCEESPGMIRTLNQQVEVATGDYWLQLDLIKYKGKFLKPGAILKNGMRLENAR